MLETGTGQPLREESKHKTENIGLEMVKDYWRARQEIKNAEKEAEEVEQEGREMEAEGNELELGVNEIESIVNGKWEESQKELLMERKHGRKKGLIGTALHQFRRFMAGGYEHPLSKFLGEHKSKIKMAGGAVALGLGILAGSPLAGMIGGAYLLKGGVESIKKYLRHRKNENGLSFEKQLESGVAVQYAFAKQLAQELEEELINDPEKAGSKEYYDKLTKLVDFKYRAERGNVEVEFYKIGQEIKTRVKGEGSEGEVLSSAKVQSLLKKDARSDLIFGLTESAAGIVGAGLGGYAGLYEAVQKAGAIGLKGFLVNIAHDKDTLGLAQKATDFHQLVQNADGTMGFVRSGAEQAFINTHPGWFEGQGAVGKLLGESAQIGAKVFNLINSFYTYLGLAAGITAAERGMYTTHDLWANKHLNQTEQANEAKYTRMLDLLKISAQKADGIQQQATETAIRQAQEESQRQEAEEIRLREETEQKQIELEKFKEKLKYAKVWPSSYVYNNPNTGETIMYPAVVTDFGETNVTLRFVNPKTKLLLAKEKVIISYQSLQDGLGPIKIKDKPLSNDFSSWREDQALEEEEMMENRLETLKNMERNLSSYALKIPESYDRKVIAIKRGDQFDLDAGAYQPIEIDWQKGTMKFKQEEEDWDFELDLTYLIKHDLWFVKKELSPSPGKETAPAQPVTKTDEYKASVPIGKKSAEVPKGIFDQGPEAVKVYLDEQEKGLKKN